MPSAVKWFRRYATVLSLFYLAVAAGGLSLIFLPEESTGLARPPAIAVGIATTITGILFAFLANLGRHLPQREGAWTLGFAIIVLGMTSVFFLPLSILLMRAWRKDEIANWFGRKAP